MKVTIVSVILLVSILIGCASTKKDFKKANDENTISAYVEFIKKHPDSEQARIADKRIIELKKIEDEKFKRSEQARKEAIEKIQDYEVGVLTEDQFFNDGWNTGDPDIGRVGVVQMITTTTRTVIVLGTCRSCYCEQCQKIGVNFIKTARSLNTGIRYNYVMRDTKNGNDITDYICRLVFKKGLLDKIEWLFR